MPWTVSDEIMICSSHQILLENGERESLHGHNWRIRVYVSADRLDKRGLIIDFADLRKAVWKVVGSWDHRHLNDLPDFAETEPSAEEMARLAFEGLAELIDDGRMYMSRVEIWMTDTGCATWSLTN